MNQKKLQIMLDLLPQLFIQILSSRTLVIIILKEGYSSYEALKSEKQGQEKVKKYLGSQNLRLTKNFALYRFYIFFIEFTKQQNMKLNSQQSNQIAQTKLLQKCTSTPSFMDTNHTLPSSNRSIDLNEEQHRKLTIRWILSFNKKVTKDTQYLAISYLNRLQKKSFCITFQNYQMVAVTVLLLASKMNEIYPPKILTMATKCKKSISEEEIIDFEGTILNELQFDLAIQNNAFTLMHSILGSSHADKLQQCQKLLRMVAPNRQIYHLGEQILAYAIIYLIIPDYIRRMKLPELHKIKTLAIRIYNIYTQAKEKHDKQKENRQR